MAFYLVFQNEEERATMSATASHNWRHQEKVFGNETEKLLGLCEKLFRAELKNNKEEVEKLQKRLYGIAKSHGVHIKWYGKSSVCQPDRFLVSGRGHDRLAFIQC